MMRLNRRIGAVLAIGVAIGVTMTATPAAGHVGGTVSHLWNTHIRPLADARYVRSACPAGMVKVGPVCIDRYETSVWSSPTGGTQYGVSSDDYPCNDNGQDCKGKFYARSVAGVTPSRYITWFQAQQALANSGKRLPTNAEWQMAAAGTPDPGDSPGSEDCNTNSASVEPTGARANCVSGWGAHDMVANLWEWVADWDEQAAGCSNFGPGYGSDVTCFGNATPTRVPGALIRGGSFFLAGGGGGTNAGPFAVNAGWEPSTAVADFGFRGAR